MHRVESLPMKKVKIKVSHQDLTRCQSCGRHHNIDRSLSSAELLLLACDFCGELLIGDQTQERPRLKVSSLSARSSKLAMGLLGASLMFGGCDDDDDGGDNQAGSTAGTMVAGELAGDSNAEPMYGAIPAGIEEAGTPIEMPLYGDFPAGIEEGGAEMAGDPSEAGLQAAYGAPPAGSEEE